MRINDKNIMNELITKIKKMSTNQLVKIYTKFRQKEISSLYDRQTLIFVVFDILCDKDILEQYNKEQEKRFYDNHEIFKKRFVELFRSILDEKMKLVNNVRCIRDLYNQEDMSFPKLSKMFNYSHIMIRNIVLYKVYKNLV